VYTKGEGKKLKVRKGKEKSFEVFL
jgi:hypothetical protein